MWPFERQRTSNPTTYRAIPRKSQLLKQIRCVKFHMENNFEQPKSKQRILTSSPRILAKYDLYQSYISLTYQIDQSQLRNWQNQFMLYTSLFLDPGLTEKDVNYLYNVLNSRYARFLNRSQNIGCLIAHLITEQINSTQEYKKQIKQIISIVYKKSQRTRQSCDFSKYMVILLQDIFEPWFNGGDAVQIWGGIEQHHEIQTSFQQEYRNQEEEFMNIWNEFNLSEYEIMKTISRLVDFKNTCDQQKKINLFCLLFLLKILAVYHNKSSYSVQFINTLQKTLQNILYVPIKSTCQYLTWFLMFSKFFKNKQSQFIRQKNPQLTQKLILSGYSLYCCVQQKRKLLNQFQINQFLDVLVNQLEQIEDRLMGIQVLSIYREKKFTFTQSQLDKQNTKKKSLKEILREKKLNPSQLIKNSQISQPTYLSYLNTSFNTSKSKRKTNPLITYKQRDQMYLFVQRLLYQNRYIQLYWALEHSIKHQYTRKIEFYYQNLEPKTGNKKIKQAQSLYVLMMIKILKNIVSKQNFLLENGFITEDFVKMIYKMVVDELTENNLMDADWKVLFKVLYNQSDIQSMMYFDVNDTDLGLRAIFDKMEKQTHSFDCLFSYQFSIFYQIYRSILSYSDKPTQISTKLLKPTHKTILTSLIQAQTHLTLLQKYQIYNQIPQSTYLKNKLQKLKKTQDSNLEYRYHMKDNIVKNQFIKSQCLRMLNLFIKYNNSEQEKNQEKMNVTNTMSKSTNKITEYDVFSQHHSSRKKLYYQLFTSLILTINSQLILVQIYSNLLFQCLSSKRQKLPHLTFKHHFSILNNLCQSIQKQQYRKFLISKNDSIVKNYISIFDNLRRVEIKRNYIQEEKKNGGGGMYFTSGDFINTANNGGIKSKTVQLQSQRNRQFHNKFNKEQQQQYSKPSQIYKIYLNHIYSFTYKQIFNFGASLYISKMFKQAIFMLEVLGQELSTLQAHIQKNCLKRNRVHEEEYGDFFWKKLNNGKDNYKQIKTKVAKILMNCYSCLSRCFRQLKPEIENILWEDKNNQTMPQYKVDIKNYGDEQEEQYFSVQEPQTSKPGHKVVKQHNLNKFQSPFHHKSFLTKISSFITQHFIQISKQILQNSNSNPNFINSIAKQYKNGIISPQFNNKISNYFNNYQSNLSTTQLKQFTSCYNEFLFNQICFEENHHIQIYEFVIAHILDIQSWQELEFVYKQFFIANVIKDCYKEKMVYLTHQYMKSIFDQDQSLSKLNKTFKQILRIKQSNSMSQYSQTINKKGQEDEIKMDGEKGKMGYKRGNSSGGSNWGLEAINSGFYVKKFQYLVSIIQNYPYNDLYSKCDKFHLIRFLKTLINNQPIYINMMQHFLRLQHNYYDTCYQIQPPQSMFNRILNKYYQISYEFMSLLELEMLQNHYFKLKNYQKVKMIINIMKTQRRNNILYSYPQQVELVNWPKVYSNQLLAKIYDFILNKFEDAYMPGMRQMINQEQNILIGQAGNYIRSYNVKLSPQCNSTSLIISKYYSCLKQQNPLKYQYLMQQLNKKIKNYLQFYKIVFNNLNLEEDEGSTHIVNLLIQFYEKIFIPGHTPKQLRQQFFLYFFRFLFQKINCRYLSKSIINKQEQRYLHRIKNQNKQDPELQHKLKTTFHTKILQFLKQNIKYTKKHIQFIIRSYDSESPTEQNNLILQYLIQLFSKLTCQFCWQLTYIKFYNLEHYNSSNKPISQAVVNSKNNMLFQRLYRKVVEKIGKDKYQQVIRIPERIFSWSYEIFKQRTADTSRRLSVLTECQKEKILFDQAIQKLPFKVKFPFDHSLFITGIKDLQYKSASGKSQPFFIVFYCQQFNYDQQAEQFVNQPQSNNPTVIINQNQNYHQSSKSQLFLKPLEKNQKASNLQQSSELLSYEKMMIKSPIVPLSSEHLNNLNSNPKLQQNKKPSVPKRKQIRIQRQCVLKYNYSHYDHILQTNSANFYCQLNILDPNTTYHVRNLTKYCYLIEKLSMNYQTLTHAVITGSGITQNAIKKYQHQRETIIQNEQRIFQPFNKFVPFPRAYNKFKQNYKQNKWSKIWIEKGILFNNFYMENIDNLHSVHKWWEYLNNYIRTLAYWSFLCLATRLGDRHKSNILMNNKGQLTHIDLEMNFGIGLNLPVPQYVPFRLNDVLTSPLGLFKQKGLFFAYFNQIAKLFDLNKDQIWKALINFTPEQRKIIQKNTQFRNLTKEGSIQHCCKVIDKALDQKILRVMYVGWQPQI